MLRPSYRPSSTDLDNLLRALEIEVVALTQLVLPARHRATMGTIDAPALHFNLSGHGRMSIGGKPPIEIGPHLLVIVPPNTPFAVEVDGQGGRLTRIERDC